MPHRLSSISVNFIRVGAVGIMAEPSPTQGKLKKNRFEMRYSKVFLEELADTRTAIFTILEECGSNEEKCDFTEEQCVDFFLGIDKLRSAHNDDFKIRHDNLSEREKEILRKLFDDERVFVCATGAGVDNIAKSEIARKFHQGVSEFRIDVAPEFARLFEHTNERLTLNICYFALAFDDFYVKTFLKQNRNDTEHWTYFTEMKKKLHDVWSEFRDLED